MPNSETWLRNMDGAWSGHNPAATDNGRAASSFHVGSAQPAVPEQQWFGGFARMFKIRHVVLLTVFALASTARAQQESSFRMEHDWTFHVGGATYGAYQWQDPGVHSGRSQTVVYYCRGHFVNVGVPICGLVAFILAPLATIAVFVVRKGKQSEET